jgi:adenine deaminase
MMSLELALEVPAGKTFFARSTATAVAFIVDSFPDLASPFKIAFGTDASVFPHGENAKQFALYVSLGMSPLEALQSATRNAAELIGVNEDLGTVEVGKYADLIAVAADPLKDIRQLEAVSFVMKAGVIVKHDTYGEVAERRHTTGGAGCNPARAARAKDGVRLGDDAEKRC